MKKQYEYQVGEFNMPTRQSAREIQRGYRLKNQLLEAIGVDPASPVPKIIQKLTMERVIR